MTNPTAPEARVKAEFPSARVDKRESWYFITARVPDLPGRRDILLSGGHMNEQVAWENAARNLAGADESSEIALALELQRVLRVEEREMVHDQTAKTPLMDFDVVTTLLRAEIYKPTHLTDFHSPHLMEALRWLELAEKRERKNRG